MSNTIAAIATPLSPAGIGVIRISGDRAIEVASKVFRPNSNKKKLESIKGYTALFGHVFDETGDIDECVALVFRAPHSYTGENVVELSCHGGLYLLRRILRFVLNSGAKPAQAGEFTKRAFVNGKIDLTSAEAVMDLISAEGEMAAKAALASKEGIIFDEINNIKKELLFAAANFTAFVDYPDDDIPELSENSLLKMLKKAEKDLSKLFSTFDKGKILREGIDTVIVGKPNVGKSTLMNFLSGSERSIVTEIPGTTRDIVEETIRLGDILLRLADTAGIHETEDMVEGIGVDKALKRAKRASLILVVFDSSEEFSTEDKNLVEKLAEGKDKISNAIAVINKSDLGKKLNTEYIDKMFKHIVYISARIGEGVEDLEQVIMDITGIGKLDSSEPILATERQRYAVKNTLECVGEAIEAVEIGMTLDAVNASIDSAISSLLELTGKKISDAVVNEVFENFCVGK